MSDATPQPPPATTNNPSYVETEDDAIETAKWTRHLPEAFGIREAIQASKYRWCAREAGMWGIATGTAMAFHRLRMQSRFGFAVHMGFLSLMVVHVGSYVICVQRRNHQEAMIQRLMAHNQFLHASDMPDEIPIDEDHPFLQIRPEGQEASIPDRQYVVNLPERKEWQPQLPTQDAADVFQPVDESQSNRR